MTISTLNGVISGMQPAQVMVKIQPTAAPLGQMPFSLWPVAGSPAAGGYSSTAAGAALTAPVTGQIPRFDPPGGTSSYLARLQSNWSANAGVMMLCDRLWDGRPNINDVTNQTINSAAWPARDVAGSTNGDGVLVGIEVSAAVSSTAAALTSYTYTNQAGTASHTGNFIDVPQASTTPVGRFFRLSLQTGDTGVRSIQNIQFSTAWTTGTINLVAYRVLAILESATLNSSAAIDSITSGFPQIFNGTVPFIIMCPFSNPNPFTFFHYIETQG